MAEIEDEAVLAAKKKGVSPYRSRFHDAMWFDKFGKQHVLVLGCGGIGSWVAFILSRIGCAVTVFDMDLIETHNLGGQMFGTANIGQYKTEAIVNICAQFSGMGLMMTEGAYDEQSYASQVMVSAFDNMKSRKLAFDKWVKHVETLSEPAQKQSIFMDGRLLAEDYQVYAVTIDKKEEFIKTLFDVEDIEVEKVMCTLKSTTHCSMMIASEIVAVMTNFFSNVAVGYEARVVPFSITKSIQSYSYDLIIEQDANESTESTNKAEVGSIEPVNSGREGTNSIPSTAGPVVSTGTEGGDSPEEYITSYTAVSVD